MTAQDRHLSQLARLIQLKTALDADTTSEQDQLQRDRQIALDSNAIRPQDQLNAWLNTQSNAENRENADRTVFVWHIVQLVVCILGLITGIGLATLVLQYDGSQPINIIEAWLVLVGLPLMMALFWLMSILPVRIPGITFVSEAMRNVLFYPFGKWLSGRLKSHTLFEHQGPSNSTLMLALSSNLMQCYGLGVVVASLVATLALLASSDLAFVWSTSLNVDEAEFHAVTSLLSAPFSNWVPSAVPSMSLIEDSHYFRFDDVNPQDWNQAELAQQLTQWWPFLTISIAIYGVLPRLLSLGLSSWLLGRTIRTEMQTLPGASSLLARMNAPLVTSSQNHAEVASSPVPETQATELQLSLTGPVVNWGQLRLDQSTLSRALSKAGLTAIDYYQAGGSQTTTQDQQLSDQIAASKPSGVIVLVKAWEPPLLEFKDWLANLQSVVDGPVVVLLVDPDQGLPSDTDLASWRNDLGEYLDVPPYVEALAL